MPSTRKPWSPGQKERLSQLLEQSGASLTWDQIGKEMGRSAGSVREAAYAYGLMPGRKVRPGTHQWGPQELERLEQMLQQGLRYRQIAEAMGLAYGQVRAAAERTGLSSPARQGTPPLVIPQAMPIIRDCIEVERMTVPMIVERLKRHGMTVSKDWIHARIREQGQGLRKELKRNATERRARLRTLQARRQRAQRQQQEARA